MSCVQFYLFFFRRASLTTSSNTRPVVRITPLSPVLSIAPRPPSLSLPVSLATRHFTVSASVSPLHTITQGTLFTYKPHSSASTASALFVSSSGFSSFAYNRLPFSGTFLPNSGE